MRFVQDLSTETISLLTRLYKQSEHHQVRQRAHCILLSNEGYSTTILMDMFKVTRLTIYNWLNGWDERGIVGLYDRSGRGRKPTFTPDQAEQIKQWVQESPNQLKQVLAKIQERWNITVSLKTLQRVLKT